MPAKPKAAVKSGTKDKSGLLPSPKNDYSHLSNDIISNIGIGIHIIQNGKFVFVSPLLQKLSGYPKSTLLGQNSLVHVHPEDRDLVKEKAIRCLKSKRKDNYEYRVIKKNGEVLWLLEMVAPIQFNGERAVLGSFMDITDHKREEITLRETQNKQGEILESIEEGYYEVNLAGNLTFVNDAIIRTWGYSRKELLGMNYRQLADTENAKKLFQSFNEVYRTGNPVKNIEWTIIKKDGTSMHVEASIVPNKNSSGNITGFRGVGRDITERKRMEEALRQSEEKHRSILENIRESYFEVDLTGNFTFFNDSLCRLTGCSREELVGMNYAKFSDEETSKIVFQTFHKVFLTGEPAEGFDWPTTRKDGIKIYVSASISLRKDPAGKPVGFRGVLRNVTERKRMEESLRQSEERHRSIIEQMHDGYFEIDLAGNFVHFNEAACQTYGYSKEELMGLNYKQYTDKETGRKLFEVFTELYRTGITVKAHALELIRKDGTKSFNEISVSLVKNAKGEAIGFRGIARDITERKRSEEQIRHMATHDTLTDLPNRTMFGQLMNHALGSAKRHQRQLAVLFTDLDGFKNINDTLGHEAGDLLLQTIALRFKQTLRSTDVVARLGGDEFVILIEEFENPDQLVTVARKILSAAMQPVSLVGGEYRVTASIGISMYPKDGQEEPILMKAADQAMYFSKERGKNNYQFYSEVPMSLASK